MEKICTGDDAHHLAAGPIRGQYGQGAQPRRDKEVVGAGHRGVASKGVSTVGDVRREVDLHLQVILSQPVSGSAQRGEGREELISKAVQVFGVWREVSRHVEDAGAEAEQACEVVPVAETHVGAVLLV